MKFALPVLREKSVVGLDIGSSCVKALELRVRSREKGFEMTRVGLAKMPPESIVQGAFLNSGAIVDAIRQAITQGGIKNRDVISAVSGHAVIVKRVNLPAMTREEMEEQIQWEAEQYIPFDVNEVNIDFQILGDGNSEGEMDVLLVAAKKDLIDDYVHVIREAGLNPVGIDVASFAVENARTLNYSKEPDEAVAMVNVGAQIVNINVMEGGAPAFSRDIANGGNQFTEEIQRTLSVGFDEAERLKLEGSANDMGHEAIPAEVPKAMKAANEALVAEIARSLDFFTATSAESRIGRAILSGGGIKVSGFCEAFKDRTGIEAEIMNPLARVLPSNYVGPYDLDAIGPELAVGVGLAARRVSLR